MEIKKLKEKNINCKIKKSAKEKIVKKRVSKTDKDSGELNRPNKPNGFHYLGHNTSDIKHGIIVDIFVTGGERADISVFPERISYIKNIFDFNIKEAVGDSGYNRPIAHFLLSKNNILLYAREIKDNIFTKTSIGRKEMSYNKKSDTFKCPQNNILKYSRIERDSSGSVHKIYQSEIKSCKDFLLKSDCIPPSKKQKIISVNILDKYIQKGKELINTERYKELMIKRQTITEGNNSLQKEYHNLRRTRKRGISKVLEHCLFSAMALNLKRLVKYS